MKRYSNATCRGRQIRPHATSGCIDASNEALAKLSGKVQWLQSFVADDKTFCVYLAESEAEVHEHARLSGFPANEISEVHTVIDPTTAVG